MTEKHRDFGAETEVIMGSTIERVADMHERMKRLELLLDLLPEMKTMLTAISTAQTMMAHSANSMAETLRKAEDRYERMEARHEALAQIATGKEQIPLKSHYWTLVAALLPTVVMSLGIVLGVLYVTKYDISASLTTLQINQKKTQELIESTKD